MAGQKKGFSEEEKAAMKERAKELLADGSDGEAAVLAKIAEMPEPDKYKAERIHAIVKECAPAFTSRTYYGMPAYSNPAGKVVCFFQAASKFKARYATLGFNDTAHLDEGNIWPIYYAIAELGEAEEAQIRELITRAVS